VRILDAWNGAVECSDALETKPTKVRECYVVLDCGGLLFDECVCCAQADGDGRLASMTNFSGVDVPSWWFGCSVRQKFHQFCRCGGIPYSVLRW
jgi:hypothetical protein